MSVHVLVICRLMDKDNQQTQNQRSHRTRSDYQAGNCGNGGVIPTKLVKSKGSIECACMTTTAPAGFFPLPALEVAALQRAPPHIFHTLSYQLLFPGLEHHFALMSTLQPLGHVSTQQADSIDWLSVPIRAKRAECHRCVCVSSLTVNELALSFNIY